MGYVKDGWTASRLPWPCRAWSPKRAAPHHLSRDLLARRRVLTRSWSLADARGTEYRLQRRGRNRFRFPLDRTEGESQSRDARSPISSLANAPDHLSWTPAGTWGA